MSTFTQLTKEQILAATKSILRANRFAVSNSNPVAGIDSVNQIIFEDSYCVGMVVYFEDWNTLKKNWIDIQTSLVERVSTVFSQTDRKSWEVYLVLFTLAHVPNAEAAEAKAIRYDTNRVRKLLSTGENLRELSDVENTLLPLLPIQDTTRLTTGPEILKRLPEVMGAKSSGANLIKIAVQAFESGESLASAIHKHWSEE
jgi:hypothetical protein